MDSSAAPKPKGSHGGRRAGSGRKKKEEVLGQSPQNAARVARNPPRTLGLPLRTAPRFINPAAPAPFFAPYNTNQPVPLGSQTTQTGRATFYAALGTSRTGLAGENTINGSAASSANGSNQTNISQAEFAQLTDQLEYIEEHDEHADIASGDRVINDSLIDEVLDSTEADAPAEAETHSSEPGKESALHKWFVSVRDRLSIEIKKYKSPLCYQRGDFYDRAPHPVFALQWSMKRNTELDPSELYPHDVFVWIPNLLPGAPNRFKCTCGKPLSRNGWNDDPIARRVRSIPADFFLLTNRFLCNPRRADPGCGTSYQGTDPHVIAQLPAFVQPAFPAYISSRGAISKVVMWQMCNTFSTRFGPSPFSQMVSEVQHRHHADGELMYLAAVLFFGRRGCKQFSKFDDREGYAGSPPSVPWLKALFTDFMAAHRIYIERYIGTLPLTISKADHTFDFLKYMSSLKGERIFSAAYTVLNEFEEVRAHALTQTKSLAVVEEMFEGIQEGLKNSNNPPTQILYTDSPQAERSFHESINRSLSHNVVAVNAWTDLPPFVRCQGIQTVIVSDSVDIENAASDVLEDLVNVSSSSSPLYLVAIAIKTDQHPGEPVRLDIIQLRTQDKIYVFRVSNLTARSDVLPSLRAILTNSSIIKIGHSVRQTLQIIAQVFSLTDLMNILKTRTPPILDLGKYAKLKGVLDDPSASFSALAGVVLRNSFSIPQFSPYPWSGTTSPQQNELLFSEIDCHWQVYLSLRARNSIGLPLQPIQAQTHGELVTLVLACKPIAEGSIVGKHSGFLDAVMDTQGHTTRISISRTRSLVQLSKVLVPGALHKLHEQTMEWIWNHGGLVVVTTSQLHTRGEIAPTPAGALARAFSVPAPPPLLDDTEFPITYESPDSQSLTSTQFEHRTESMPSYGGEDESDSDEDSGTGEDGRSRFVFEVEPNADTIAENEAQPLGSSIDESNISADVLMENLENTFNFLRQEATFPTRVLDDAFHYMDRLLRLLSKKHSAFKAFAHDFSEAIFIRDKSDVLAVRAVLERHGINWEYAKRAKGDALNRRIRRYIPERGVLLKRLEKLFNAYADIQCSTKASRGSFFSDEAKEMTVHLLDTVRKGYLSDPPGISLYYLMGKDRDGLNLYRTVRGTNSVEGGFHMVVRRIFGSLRASAELAECLLINWILRRNLRVGFYNRTGEKYRGHVDIWIRDEIAELAVAAGMQTSFPLPRVLPTRIATSETVGILPISKSLADNFQITTLPRVRITGVPHHRDTPVHIMTRLSTKPTNPYRYLQLRQHVLSAVVPVHTHQEYLTFKANIDRHDFRKSGKQYPSHERYRNVDFDKFTRWWNVQVNFQSRSITESNLRLYYKIPQHLEAHHKKTILWSSERSTLAAGANFAARQDFVNILNSEDNYADVLPAIRFTAVPDGELDLSSAALDEPISFDLTSGRPVAGNDAFDALTSFDSTGEHPAEDDSLDMNDLIEWEASLAPTTATIPPLVFPSNPPLRQIEQQMRLPGAPETVPRKSKKAKRCAPCVKAYCRRRNKCNGRGGKDLCNCIPPHPKMAPGERARIPEEVIEAYLAQQDQNS